MLPHLHFYPIYLVIFKDLYKTLFSANLPPYMLSGVMFSSCNYPALLWKNNRQISDEELPVLSYKVPVLASLNIYSR